MQESVSAMLVSGWQAARKAKAARIVIQAMRARAFIGNSPSFLYYHRTRESIIHWRLHLSTIIFHSFFTFSRGLPGSRIHA
jgi:hypothetical protein